MKKLIFSLLLLPAAVLAQSNVEPVMLPGFYAVRISPNGKWIASQSGNAAMYNVETGDITPYQNCEVGLGNAVADNGMIAGDGPEGAGIFFEGEVIYSPILQTYRYNQLNGINSSASQIVGNINNPNEEGSPYVPFIADIDDEGLVTEMTLLPFPPKDLFNSTPQMVTANWVSEDGKTVAGLVQDGVGYYIYPIMYQQNDNGTWEYYLPSESLFNPDKLNIPRNPYENEPVFPEAVNFMNGNRKDAYQEAYKAYVAGQGLKPDIADYMTEEEYKQYLAAVEAYNNWYNSDKVDIDQFFDIYFAVIDASPIFELNELTLHASGDYMLMRGGYIQSDNSIDGKIYQFSPEGLERIIDVPKPTVYPAQVLTDGTIIGALPMTDLPSTFMLLPGADKFITVQEYLEPEYPELVDWMNETFPNGTGLVVVSDNISVMAGALLPDMMADYGENSNYTKSTYVFSDLAPAGVESIVAPVDDGVYRVYNLQGVKMLETKDASKINTLPADIYIINGKKVLVK